MTDFRDDEKTYEFLREKIKSKRDVTKFFSGFVSIVFGIMLKDTILGLNAAYSEWLVIGMCLIVFSLSAAIASLFAYDRLLMPPKFLEGSDRVGAIKNKRVFILDRNKWRVKNEDLALTLFGDEP